MRTAVRRGRGLRTSHLYRDIDAGAARNPLRIILRIVIAAFFIILVIVASYVIYYTRFPPPSPPVCGPSLQLTITSETGYSYFCGETSVSDGNLEVTLHGYRFTQAKNIDFEPGSGEISPSPTDIILLANVSVSNVGGGNTSLGGGFAVEVSNGTYSIQNQDFIENASFSNTIPNQTLPDIEGGLYLPPGANANLWVMFYIPGATQAQISTLSLKYLSYREVFYGGDYQGLGAFSCRNVRVACTYPLVEFVLAPQ